MILNVHLLTFTTQVTQPNKIQQVSFPRSKDFPQNAGLHMHFKAHSFCQGLGLVSFPLTSAANRPFSLVGESGVARQVLLNQEICWYFVCPIPVGLHDFLYSYIHTAQWFEKSTSICSRSTRCRAVVQSCEKQKRLPAAVLMLGFHPVSVDFNPQCFDGSWNPRLYHIPNDSQLQTVHVHRVQSQFCDDFLGSSGGWNRTQTIQSISWWFNHWLSVSFADLSNYLHTWSQSKAIWLVD